MKKILMLSLALFLGGCILQSETPNFSEANGKPLLGKAGGSYLAYSLDKGVWTVEDKPVSLLAVGKHYEFSEKGKTTEITSIPISGEWWIAQFQEGKEAAVYVLADKQTDAIYIHTLGCDDLKKLSWSKTHVTFVKDDCFLAAHTKAEAFKDLIGVAGPRTMKLVLQN